MNVSGSHFSGIVYRAHHPMWAYLPLSGEGAKRYGGRFNRPGTATLYTALDLTTAWLEAQQGFPFKAQPMTMVAYRVDCSDIVDLTDPQLLKNLDFTEAMLGCAWEDLAWQNLQPPTWLLASRLLAAGFVGAKVRSFAPGCAARQHNLVLWRWGDDATHAIDVIDDFGRLPKSTEAWRET
ncbi:MAG: hypothetical protein CTY19_09005 [Methylomonas sp.]|nr:MAG: hypothetical protein CTY19_09005 [Methylomonas sp.]